jgi:subtilisin family serine protease
MRWLPCFLTLAALPWLAAQASPEAAPIWKDKVRPEVLRGTENGSIDFLVLLEGEADLGYVRAIEDKAARARAVAATLAAGAARSQAPLRAWLAARGVEHRAFWIANMVLVRGDRALLEAIAERSDVVRVEANPTVRAPLPPPEPAALGGGAIEWNVSQIGADQAWAMGFTGEGVVIAGQDTGYDWDHPALVSAYRGWDGSSADHDHNWHDAIHSGGGSCGADSPGPCDDGSHGTHTMGTMVGDDGGANRIGVAPGARWIGCRNMDQGWGTPATYAECFEWFLAPTDGAGANPDPSKAPHVINNSWVCPPVEGCSYDTLATIVANVREAGIVVVASAGNSGSDCSTIDDPPALYADSFSVGATSSSDAIAGFSSRGPVTIDGSGRTKPDVSAPGVGIRSSTPNGNYGSSSGTSMAGPHVAGLVALLLDARPDLAGKVDEIETLIERSALPRTSGQTCGDVPGTDVPNNTFGHGRVDAVAMLTGDADADGASNLDDCRPVDATTWSTPFAVDDLTLSGGASTLLSWGEPADPGGTAAPRYDVLRATAPDGFAGATCLVSDTSDTTWLDASPAPSHLFYYLVRASGTCGSSLGTSSSEAPRPAADCPP